MVKWQSYLFPESRVAGGLASLSMEPLLCELQGQTKLLATVATRRLPKKRLNIGSGCVRESGECLYNAKALGGLQARCQGEPPPQGSTQTSQAQWRGVRAHSGRVNPLTQTRHVFKALKAQHRLACRTHTSQYTHQLKTSNKILASFFLPDQNEHIFPIKELFHAWTPALCLQWRL